MPRRRFPLRRFADAIPAVVVVTSPAVVVTSAVVVVTSAVVVVTSAVVVVASSHSPSVSFSWFLRWAAAALEPTLMVLQLSGFPGGQWQIVTLPLPFCCALTLPRFLAAVSSETKAAPAAAAAAPASPRSASWRVSRAAAMRLTRSSNRSLAML